MTDQHTEPSLEQDARDAVAEALSADGYDDLDPDIVDTAGRAAFQFAYGQVATAVNAQIRQTEQTATGAPSVSDRLRAAATAAHTAMASPVHPAPLDVAAMWQPAVDALTDLADVLEPPHDPIAAAIVAALTDTGATR